MPRSGRVTTLVVRGLRALVAAPFMVAILALSRLFGWLVAVFDWLAGE